jgi:hydantoinase/carbamoylase family amidase
MLVDNLHTRIAHLARFNADVAAGGITREIYTPEYVQATEYVSELMRDAGLEVRLDAVGNLFGRWTGRSPELPRVLTGSHYDTTLNAGRLDGVLGVLGAIEAVRRLRDRGHAPERTIEVVGFAGEEPRFGAGCLGSRAMMGQLARADLDSARDRNGVTIAEAMRASGFDPDRVADAQIVPEDVHALVELHIEQGSVLETERLPLGIVESIAAPHDHRVTLSGMARHAGSTPMTMRRDALAGAAEIVLAVERLARDSASGTTVGTVGVLDLEPGAINVIPGRVAMDIDVRDRDLAVRDRVVSELLETIERVARARGLDVTIEMVTHDVPQACAPRVIDAVRGACEALEIPHRAMVSGAYHDSMVLGAAVPMGMIFVPSVDGISHHPDEDTDPEHLDLGVAVLTATLERLAG